MNEFMHNMRNVLSKLPVILFVLFFQIACEEAKRFEININDNTPPDVPLLLDYKSLPGGARIYYRPPVDEDLLFVEASYTNTSGELIRFTSSYLTDSLDIYGFGAEGEHKINLRAADRSGNYSETITETIVALEPPVVSVSKTIQILPSFGSMLVKWNNLSQTPLYIQVDFDFEKDGNSQVFTRIFSSFQLRETHFINDLHLDENETINVKVSVKDKYNNNVNSIDTSFVLLTDVELNKENWLLPTYGYTMGGVVQANGSELNGKMEACIDGFTEETHYMNFYQTTASNPWNIIIDLGQDCELSRIVTHQRYTGEQSGSPQGNYFRGDNVLAYNMYIWDDANQSWEFVTRHDINPPVVKQETDYKLLGEAGDAAFLYKEEPRFSKPTRYFRFEAIRGKYISEITLYGRPN